MNQSGRTAILILCLGGFETCLAQNPYALPSSPPGAVTLSGRRELTWNPVKKEDLDVKLLTEQGGKALDFPGMKWEHAQSDHFAVHFEREIFAKKVARMAEFYYGYVSNDIEGPKDRMDGRSHIFVFRTPEKWKAFLASTEAPSWYFSFVSGPVMYLQEADDTESSAGVLAHEMSHLILNRFFSKNPPVWLNEGLAEWYGEFAYAAFKGIKKSQRTEFKALKHPYPMQTLLAASTYPEDPDQVGAFYETSKFAVAYLRLAWPGTQFVSYLQQITEGVDADKALQAHFNITSSAEFETGFAKFLR